MPQEFEHICKQYEYQINYVDGQNVTVAYMGTLNANAKTINIPKTVTIDGKTYKVTEVMDNTFKGNKKLTKVIVGNNVTTIGKNTFSGCSKLKNVTLGKSVTAIGANAFKSCKKLEKITIQSTKLSANAIAKSAFKGISKNTVMKVPKKKLNAYKKLLKSKGLSKKVKIK